MNYVWNYLLHFLCYTSFVLRKVQTGTHMKQTSDCKHIYIYTGTVCRGGQAFICYFIPRRNGKIGWIMGEWKSVIVHCVCVQQTPIGVVNFFNYLKQVLTYRRQNISNFPRTRMGTYDRKVTAGSFMHVLAAEPLRVSGPPYQTEAFRGPWSQGAWSLSHTGGLFQERRSSPVFQQRIFTGGYKINRRSCW